MNGITNTLNPVATDRERELAVEPKESGVGAADAFGASLAMLMHAMAPAAQTESLGSSGGEQAAPETKMPVMQQGAGMGGAIPLPQAEDAEMAEGAAAAGAGLGEAGVVAQKAKPEARPNGSGVLAARARVREGVKPQAGPLNPAQPTQVAPQATALTTQPKATVPTATVPMAMTPKGAAAAANASVNAGALQSTVAVDGGASMLRAPMELQGFGELPEVSEGSERLSAPWEGDSTVGMLRSGRMGPGMMTRDPISGLGMRGEGFGRSALADSALPGPAGSQAALRSGLTSGGIVGGSDFLASREKMSAMLKGEPAVDAGAGRPIGKAPKRGLGEAATVQVEAAGIPAARLGAAVATPAATSVVQGQVIPGGGMRDRLDTESVRRLGGEIESMRLTGGGEIRIRLKPENLGELHIRVTEHGGQVGLEIRASDENSKRIIEESLSSLKESLAQSQVSLGKLDVAVRATHDTASGGMSSDHRQESQHQGQLSMAMDQRGGGQSFSRDYGGNGGGASDGRSQAPGWNVGLERAATRGAGRTGSSRLDVMA